jgi:hypothetical protein
LKKNLSFLITAGNAFAMRSSVLWAGAAVSQIVDPLLLLLDPYERGLTMFWPDEKKWQKFKEFKEGIQAPWKKISEAMNTRDPQLLGEALAEIEFQVASVGIMVLGGAKMFEGVIARERVGLPGGGSAPRGGRGGAGGPSGGRQPVAPPPKPTGFITKEMLEYYRGVGSGGVPENAPGNKIWPNSWVRYFSPQMRAAYRLTLRDGLLFDARGNLFDTAAAPGGRAIFVMDRFGDIYAYPGPSIPGRLHHSSLLAGEPVAMAGDMKATGGRITDLSRETGHYETTLDMLNQFIGRLRWGGADVSQIKIEPYMGP